MITWQGDYVDKMKKPKLLEVMDEMMEEIDGLNYQLERYVELVRRLKIDVDILVGDDDR